MERKMSEIAYLAGWLCLVLGADALAVAKADWTTWPGRITAFAAVMMTTSTGLMNPPKMPAGLQQLPNPAAHPDPHAQPAPVVNPPPGG
jgi:hypothetical protein